LIFFAAAAVIMARAQDADPLAGVWQGPVSGKPGTFQIYFTIDKTGGETYAAKVDIPAQNVRGIPVTAVRWNAPELFLDMSSYGITFQGRMDDGGGKITGRFKIGPEDLPLVLSRGGAVPEAGRPQDPQKPYPYDEIEVSFPNPDAGITLSGTLTLPPGPGPFPAAVLVTGSGPQDRDSAIAGHRPFLVLADYLTRRGLAVLRCDDRGCGDSTGDFHEATTADFASDAMAAWKYLNGRPEIRAGAVGLIGHSEGADISAMAAAREKRIAFTVFLAGMGLPGAEIMLSQTEAMSRANGAGEEAIQKEKEYVRRQLRILREQADPAKGEAEMNRLAAEYLTGLTETEKKQLGVSADSLALDVKSLIPDYAWNRFLAGYDPDADLSKIRCPVLALNGDKDTQVPAEPNLGAIDRSLKKAGNTRVDIRRLPGLNHLFQTAKTGHPREYAKIEETLSPDVMKMIADWIRGLF